MNYKQNYEDYISYVKTLNRKRKDCVYEEHHILPRSIEGTDEAFNKVLLTPREHYLAHFLLMKIYEGSSSYKKMVYAFLFMNFDKHSIRHHNSRLYEKVKLLASKEQKKYLEEGSDTYNEWYSKWEKGAVHIKDKSSIEYKNWKNKTKASIPQLRSSESLEYKDWYNKMLKTHSSCMPKDSLEYKDWYSKMMLGKKEHKKVWVHNNNLQKTKTIDIQELDKYIIDGWEKGRSFVKVGQVFDI